MHINDAPVGRSVDETLRLIEAFKYTDDHGEVCPAGWKPGDATVCYEFIIRWCLTSKESLNISSRKAIRIFDLRISIKI